MFSLTLVHNTMADNWTPQESDLKKSTPKHARNSVPKRAPPPEVLGTIFCGVFNDQTGILLLTCYVWCFCVDVDSAPNSDEEFCVASSFEYSSDDEQHCPTASQPFRAAQRPASTKTSRPHDRMDVLPAPMPTGYVPSALNDYFSSPPPRKSSKPKNRDRASCPASAPYGVVDVRFLHGVCTVIFLDHC